MKNYPKIFYPQNPLNHKGLVEFDGYKRGWTESYFKYKLDKYFSKHLKTNMVIDNRWKFPYQPDFILYYPKYKLCIDIEIDEPYAMSNKEPIHFNDNKRNDFFLSKGWYIIRFAEEQICRYPDLCCKMISEFLKFITGESIWIEGMQNLNNIPDISAWTKHDAQKMAHDSFRNKYLSYLQKIDQQSPQISMLVDGIFLNSQINDAKNIYIKIWPEKQFYEKARISLLLKELLRYFCHFPNISSEENYIYIEFRIYISTYHSIYNFTFDTDLIYLDDYIVNVYYVRTDGLICFEIDDYIRNNRIMNIFLIADDPTYSNLISKWMDRNIILMRKKDNSHMPLDIKYVDSILPSGFALGLNSTEL